MTIDEKHDPGAGDGVRELLPTLSVVIPVYNEFDSIDRLYRRLLTVVAGLPVSGHEILFVDDGSPDASFAEVLRLGKGDAAVRGIRFARNFGKEAAMAAGLQMASGDVVVLMDGDLQHPPELIPAMFERWQDGAHMVTAVRRSRDTDPWLRNVLSHAFYRLFARLCEVSLAEGGGDFRLFDRAVVDAINSLPERNRFMKGITSWVGFRQDRVPFDPAARETGGTRWSMWRLLRYALDGISAFSTFPLRVWSLIGFWMAFLSGGYGLWLLFKTTIWGVDIPGYASLMLSVLFTGGIQLISLGVLGEYVGRIFTEVKARPLYLVAETIGFEAPPR